MFFPTTMILILLFLIGVTLTLYLAPAWPLIATLLVPLVVVLVGRLALFWIKIKDK